MGPESSHVELANARLAVRLDLGDGAKVVSLRCPHGREWLEQPGARTGPSAGGVFGASESWGWDELFPTVLPGRAAPAPWEAPLRDHGELWGRPWGLVEASPSRVIARYRDPAGRFDFVRSLALRQSVLRADYKLANRGSAGLPFVWALHPILALAPGERIAVPGLRTPGEELEVAEPDGVTVLKLYAAGTAAAVDGGCCRLSLRADGGGPVTAIGLYLNYGGWPEPGSGLHQVGIEPTTAGVDDLQTAVERSIESYVEPGGEFGWGVELALDSVEP